MDFSAIAARLVCPEVPLADALIQLTLRAPRPENWVRGLRRIYWWFCSMCHMLWRVRTFIASQRTPAYGAVTPY
jgi:hypothetical protein